MLVPALAAEMHARGADEVGRLQAGVDVPSMDTIRGDESVSDQRCRTVLAVLASPSGAEKCGINTGWGRTRITSSNTP
jgi:hypothetical protein